MNEPLSQKLPSSNPQTEPSHHLNHQSSQNSNIFHSPIFYLMLFVFLVIGIGLGYLLHLAVVDTTRISNQAEIESTSPKTISLPSDAVRIQTCSTGRGALYIKPSDIPRGPIYMVHNDKVVGLEYMISQDEFLSGTSVNDLVGFEMPVNHVNIGRISEGHAGYTEPHYHVDLLMITPEAQTTIVCESGTENHTMPGHDMTETSSESSQTMEMQMEVVEQ